MGEAKSNQQNGQTNQPVEDQEFWAGQWTSSLKKGIEPPDAPTWFNERDIMLMDFIRPYLPSNGTVAELGCGSGRCLARISLERPDLTFVAVDYEEEALHLVQESARVYGAKIRIYLDDVNKLKFSDASFEMVLSGGLLEHFVDPMPPLREMVRILKPGGTLYASVVPRKLFSLHRPLHRILGPQVYRTKHNAYVYADWLRELGLVNVRGVTKGLYPPLFHHLPAAPRRVIEQTCRRLDGTWLADRLGYFFVVVGQKPG